MSGAHIIQYLYLRENFKNFQPKLFPTSTNHPIYFYLAAIRRGSNKKQTTFQITKYFPSAKEGTNVASNEMPSHFAGAYTHSGKAKWNLLFLEMSQGKANWYDSKPKFPPERKRQE